MNLMKNLEKKAYLNAQNRIRKIEKSLPKTRARKLKAINTLLKDEINLASFGWMEGEDEIQEYFDIKAEWDDEHAPEQERMREIEAKFGSDYLSEVYEHLHSRNARILEEQIVRWHFVRWKKNAYRHQYVGVELRLLKVEIETAALFSKFLRVNNQLVTKAKKRKIGRPSKSPVFYENVFDAINSILDNQPHLSKNAACEIYRKRDKPYADNNSHNIAGNSTVRRWYERGRSLKMKAQKEQQ